MTSINNSSVNHINQPQNQSVPSFDHAEFDFADVLQEKFGITIETDKALASNEVNEPTKATKTESVKPSIIARVAPDLINQLQTTPVDDAKFPQLLTDAVAIVLQVLNDKAVQSGKTLI